MRPPRRSIAAAKTGLPPGTPLHLGEEKRSAAEMRALCFSKDAYSERSDLQPQDLGSLEARGEVVWVNLHGVHDVEAVEACAAWAGLHPLVTEDIVNTQQRPKVEYYDDYLYASLKMLTLDPRSGEVESEQVSLVLTGSRVLTFQERPGDVFEPIRDRIRTGRGYVRRMGADYLFYALIDAVVDNYFVVLEHLEQGLQDLESRVEGDPSPAILHAIHYQKTQQLLLRRSAWPLREIVSRLERRDIPLITAETSFFLRDVYDHIAQILDGTESLREVIGNIHDLYLSVVSNRMNNIMKVLTIIATIFIPLTFIAGVYGMNFAYMPELQWRFGYPLAVGFMALVASVMVLFFRRKRWF